MQEGVLLGCILQDNTIIKEVTLTVDHFNDVRNKQIYKVMLDLEREGVEIDPITIMDKVGVTSYNQLGGGHYIQQLMNSVPSSHAFKTYENLIIRDWKERESKRLLHQYSNQDLKEGEIQKLIAELNILDESNHNHSFNKKSLLLDMYEEVDTETPKGMSGIPTGLTDLDKFLDGFQEEESIIIGARPSMGKTATILNMALAAGKSGAIPVIFSLEMSEKLLLKRLISSIANIDGFKTKNPFHYMNDKEKERWKDAITVLEKIEFYIYDKSGMKINEMRAKIRRIQRDNPNQKVIAFIDYLTLIQPREKYNGNSHQQITEISADLKAMAKDFKIPVVTLAQLSRGVEQRQDKRPMMSDLRESGSIEQDADVIMFLYRDDYYNKESENANILEIIIAKQRNGALGTVEAAYIKEFSKVVNLDRRMS
ncbi:replicative DNA helicase [Alkalihalobacillus trypoxylicola]|uniref:DNA 5'-3' helicase n=1 Tax=Alkalihalobacillus trypoxylicola TaxID=519424 RepID=A0A162D584_9BACI|nr:replicative DNA helicase [Alkalihalobacillus trypoxylicola]KYG28149.1 hypothetical protein AZF04_09605 [Alkalihalobacillus trypoxylicola]